MLSSPFCPRSAGVAGAPRAPPARGGHAELDATSAVGAWFQILLPLLPPFCCGRLSPAGIYWVRPSPLPWLDSGAADVDVLGVENIPRDCEYSALLCSPRTAYVPRSAKPRPEDETLGIF